MADDFVNYASAIAARLVVGNSALFAGVTVLTEDMQDLDTQIEKAIGEVGMMILIGEPHAENSGQASRVANMKITSEIAVGEVPVLWRDPPANTKPRATAIVREIIRQVMGLPVAGFTPIRLSSARPVPHKTRKIWELALEAEWIVGPDPVVRTP